MKIGVAVKVDVTKLDKARFFKGKKGIYADLTMFIDTENVSEYGDNGTISQSVSQEERQGGVKLPICGNAKIFFTDGGDAGNQNHGGQQTQNTPQEDQDIPF